MSNKNKDKQYQSKVQELSHNIRLCLPQTLLPSAIQSRAFQCVDSAVTNLVSDSQALSSTLNWLKFEKKNDGIFGTILSIGYIELLDQEFNRLYLNKEETIQYILSYYHQQNYRVSEKTVTESLQSLNKYIFQIWPSSIWQSKSLENLIVLSTNNWLSITNEICKMIWFKINGSALYKEYQVLAEFFEKISESPSSNRLSALFYHLSQGEVPPSVWNKCRFDLGQTLPTVENLDVIKGLARSANQNTPITNSFPALPPASTSNELDSQDSQELTIEDKELLAIPIFWLKFLPFLRNYDELILLLSSQEPTPVPPPSPVSPNDQTFPTTNQNTEYEAILYGIPVKRKLTLLEKLQLYFVERFSLLFGLLFKTHQIPASGLILLALALLAGSAGYQAKGLQMSHCKSPDLASTVISKIPLIGVNCSDTLSPEELTIAALNKIVEDFKEHLKTENADSQAKIIELLDSTGNGKIYHLDFQQIEPKGWLVFWRRPKTEDLSNWNTAIRDYQQQAIAQQKQAGVNKKFILPLTGAIKAKDSTDEYLRCELQRDLQLYSKPDKIEQCRKYGVTGLTPDSTNPPSDLRPTPLPSVSPTTRPSATPKPSRPSSRPSPSPTPTSPTDSGSQTFIDGGDMGSADWPTTSKALDALRDEVANAHTKFTKVQVEKAIGTVLPVQGAAYQFKDGKGAGKYNSETWIKGIQSFQNTTGNYTAYGSIIENDSTYNLLKCEVAKNLKIQLNKQPDECSSNPELN
jgi:hypothetical protein